MSTASARSAPRTATWTWRPNTICRVDRPRVGRLQRVVLRGRSRSRPSGAAKGCVPEPARRAQPATPAASSRRAAASAARPASIESQTGEAVSIWAAASSPAQRHALAELLVHARGHRQQVERVGVEQHQLLLDADRVVGHPVEELAQAGSAHGLRHGATLPAAAIAERAALGRERGVRIVVFPGVLRPPSDTALLGGVMARHDLAGRTVLDLCTGTGILGLTAARLGARATAVDLSRRAVLNARLNARLNRLALEVLRGDLFEPVAGPPLRPHRLQPALHPGAARRRAARRGARVGRGPGGPRVPRPHLRRARRSTCAPAGACCSCTRASPAPRRPSGGSPRTASSRPSRPPTTGASARSRCERLDYLRSIGVVDESLSERMVVVEGGSRRRRC